MNSCVRKIVFSGFCSIVLLTLFSLPFCAFAQEDVAGSIRLQDVSAVSFIAEEDHEDGPNEYVWRAWYNDTRDKTDAECVDFIGIPDHHNPGEFFRTVFFVHHTNPYLIKDPVNTRSIFGMEGYEDDKAPLCRFDKEDAGHCETEQSIRYLDYPPEILNELVLDCGDFAVTWRFRYSLPKPKVPAPLNPIDAQYCGSDPIRLTTETFLGEAFRSNNYKFQTVWEYSLDANSWSHLGVSDVYFNFTSVSPRSEIDFPVRSLPDLKNITVNTSVVYRVKTRMTVLGGPEAGKVFDGVYTQGNNLGISPSPPSITLFSSTPSCPAPTNSGSVTVTITGGTPSHIYQLVQGEKAPCNPEDQGGTGCGAAFTRSNLNTFTFENVPKERYTVIVTNGGKDLNAGVCQARVFVNVGELPVLQLPLQDITPVTCPGSSDGKVNLISGGGVAPWEYTLSKTSFTSTNTTGEFTGLLAGDYTATVLDGCDQRQTAPVKVSEPLRIEAASTPGFPSCDSPADGSVRVDITQGEGTYSFKLIKDDQPVKELNNATVNSWTVEGLSDGDYTLEIRDAQRLQCAETSIPVTLIPPKTFALDQNGIVKKDLTCFEQNDGSIQLNNADVSGDFKYILSGQSGGTSSVISTTTLFKNLPADIFTLTLKRSVTGCDDEFILIDPLELRQPEKITIAFESQDVRCHDQQNGRITSVIGGATASDRYQWETLIGGNWASLSATTSFLNNLSGGTYRMKLINSNNCQAGPEEITIAEPLVLAFTKVNKTDITCLGQNGEVEAILQGGTLPYSYSYSTSSTVVQSLTEKTSLTPGVYVLFVADANGCEVTHPGQLSITSPPSVLSFKYTLSDFNGFNLSCTGANNGIADITATGGNGIGYSGYTYALDDTNFQGNARIKNISAGPHTLFVQDDRGCTVGTQVTFTEPLSELEPELLLKEDVKCLGDDNGKLSITTHGGVAPYIYRINLVSTQENGSFSGLAPGNYTIVISDKNGCTTTYHDEVILLTQPIEITLLKTDATCYNKANGVIQADVTGGAQPLHQEWKDGSGTIDDIDGLLAGVYTLSVADQQGCTLEKSITIGQPEDLSVTVTSIPVCVGKTTGELRVEAHGGVGAYSYSADGGTTYQHEPKLQGLAAGAYHVMVKDANGCEHVTSAAVDVRNDLPQPNFLVASSPNALDTLVIREISVPKPDSVEWTFDPTIKVVTPDTWSPQIMVEAPGNYAIEMKGYFGGCDYTSTLSITINPFDPDGKFKNTDIPLKAIKTMAVTPNPNDGEFNVAIELAAKQHLVVSVIDVSGVTHFHQTWNKTLSINERINIRERTSSSGIFIVRAVTDTDAQEIRILIDR